MNKWARSTIFLLFFPFIDLSSVLPSSLKGMLTCTACQCNATGWDLGVVLHMRVGIARLASYGDHMPLIVTGWETTCPVPSCRVLQPHILFFLPGAGASFTGVKCQFGVVHLMFPSLATGCGCHDPVKSSSAKKQRDRIYKISNRKEFPEVAHEPQPGLLWQGKAERCVTAKCPYKAVTLARWGPAVCLPSWHYSPWEAIKLKSHS